MTRETSGRWRRILLSLVLLSTVAFAAVVVDWQATDGPDSSAPESTTLASPDGTSGYVWPYTSRSRSDAGRTLALNVVVRGNSERVRRVLVTRSDANWSSTDRNATVRLPPWRRAHGSVRYTYVSSGRNASGRWIPADYQLHVGTYFGHRTHVRAYSGQSGNWTALQAHTEYWDWFRVRHTVTGVASGARFVERDLRDEPLVERVTRTTHGNRGGGSEGWWTVVYLVPALGLAGGVVRLTSRQATRDVAIPVALLGVVLGVRGWGLAAEAAFPGATPKLFVAIGYPVLAIAPPALVTVLATDRPAARVVSLTAAGFAAGLVLDAALVGVQHVPPMLVSHRAALVATLVVIALGAARDNRPLVGIGVVAWLCALAAPLLGFV